MRAYVLTTTSPRPSPPGEGVDSPAAKRHPLLEGEAFQTHEMGTNNPPAIPLAPLEGGMATPLKGGKD
jgi:hypothetical protein